MGNLLSPTARAANSQTGADGGTAAQDLADLIDRVVPTEDRGGPGPGRIRVWGGVTLIVNDTADVQRDVDRFLCMLRQVKPR